MITGREDILDFCRKEFKVHSWTTVRRWRTELSFPIHYLPSNAPFLFESEAILWAVKYSELTKEQKNRGAV